MRPKSTPLPIAYALQKRRHDEGSAIYEAVLILRKHGYAVYRNGRSSHIVSNATGRSVHTDTGLLDMARSLDLARMKRPVRPVRTTTRAARQPDLRQGNLFPDDML